MRGWILAGGASSRFGSDKAVWPIGGVPAAVHLAGVLRSAGLDPWIVARVPRQLGVPELLEPPGERHPLHGVAAALAASAAAGESLACVLPCDLVELSVAQVVALLAAGPAVAGGQPLLAVLPVAWAERAATFAAQGRSVRAFVEGLPVVDVGEVPNLNRPPG